jgi:competence protein ComEC
VEKLRFRRAPLLAAACWFALGILLARNWVPSAVLLIAVILVFILVVIAPRITPRIAVIPVAGLWVITGFWCWQIRPTPPPQKDLTRYADGLSRAVNGRVVRIRELDSRTKAADQDTDPTEWIEQEPETSALSVDLQTEEIEEVTPDISRMVTASGGVRTTVVSQSAALPSLHCGDLIEAPMILKIPVTYHDPGAWQYADYLREQGINLQATVRSTKLHILERGKGSLRCRLYFAQSWASAQMRGFVQSQANRRLPHWMRLTDEDAGMLNAMLFGHRTRLNHALRLGFERTGSFHLFVVSGMHVALLAGLVFWLCKRLHLNEWFSTLLALASTLTYALLTGFGAPVQRALFMSAIFLIARLFSRERSVLNALGAASLGILVLSPEALQESSFQMTFLAIFAIAGVAAPLGEQTFFHYARAARNIDDIWRDQSLEPAAAQFRVILRLWGSCLKSLLGKWAFYLPASTLAFILWAGELALIGVVVEMVMALPMAVYFHRATIFALPANIFTIPVVVVLAPLAVITFCASIATPWLAMVPSAFTAMLLHAISRVIGFVSHLHTADVRIPAPMWQIWVLAVVVWFFCCWAVRRSSRWVMVAVVAMPIATAAVLWPEHPLFSPGRLELTAIDVGQGDSLLLVSPAGSTMLIDSGGPVGRVRETALAASVFDIGEEVVSPYLWSRRFRNLDVLVLSHAHSDHMGGMPSLIRNFRPKELWVGIDPKSEAYRSLLAEAQEFGVTIRHFRAGDFINWGGARVAVLAPDANYSNEGPPVNDDSLVMRVEYGAASLFLEGDAEATSEQSMLAQHRITPVSLLKVGHHGSRSSTTPAFLAAVAPKAAIVSVGRNNTFGHPRFEVIDRIARAKSYLYRTDEFGLTTFLLEKNGRIQVKADEVSLSQKP